MGLSGSQKAYKHARAGVARAGAARHNYFLPIVPVLKIDGWGRSSDALRGSWRVALNAFDQPDTCTGRVRGGAGWTPVVGQTLTLGIGEADNRIFGGRIEAITKLYVSTPGVSFYDILAVDSTRRLSDRLVLKRYVAMDAGAIVQDIIATYAPSVTTAHVMSSLGTIDDITFTMEPVYNALTRLAERITGCRWYVDEFGDLYFGTTIPVTPAPAALTNASAVPFRNVSLRQDLSQVRTRVYVEGRGGAMSEYQASFGASPDISVDTPSELFGDPADYTESMHVRWRTLVLEYTDVDDTGFDHLSGVYANTTAYNASSEDRPREGDEVNQWVTYSDNDAANALGALEGGDGWREAYVQDRRLNYDGAVARGAAELAQFSAVSEVLEYDTQDVNARPGRDVTVSLTGAFEVSGTYRIQSVTIDAIGSVTTRFPWRRVTATSAIKLNLWDLLRRTSSPTFAGSMFGF